MLCNPIGTYRSKVSGTLPWQNWLNCRLQWTAPRLRCKPIQSLKYIKKINDEAFPDMIFCFLGLNKYLLTVKQMTDSDAHNHKELNSDWTSPKIRSKITLGKSLFECIHTMLKVQFLSKKVFFFWTSWKRFCDFWTP